MAISPAFTGFFWCFAALVLLLFVSVSCPTWRDIYFLKATAMGKELRWGLFGSCYQTIAGGAYTCTKHTFGYNLDLTSIGVNANYSTTTLHEITRALIVHPIAGALALGAVIWGLLGVCAASRFCTVMMSLTAFLALVGALLALALDLALWLIVRKDLDNAGYSGTLGNAIWMTVGACAALVLGTCTAACGSCGRFATGRMGGEKY